MKKYLTDKVSVSINTSISQVWEALTKPELIKQYFFNADVFSDWKVGSFIVFRGEWEGKSYEHKGTILNVESNKLLRYSYWNSMSGIEDKPENYVNITYELFEEDNKTTLDVTQENIPNEKMKEASEQYWTAVLHNIRKILEKEPAHFV